MFEWICEWFIDDLPETIYFGKNDLGPNLKHEREREIEEGGKMQCLWKWKAGMTAEDASPLITLIQPVLLQNLSINTFLSFYIGGKEGFMGKERQYLGLIFVSHYVYFDGWSYGCRTDRRKPGGFLCSTKSHMTGNCNQTAICEASNRSFTVCACCGCLAPNSTRSGISGASV